MARQKNIPKFDDIPLKRDVLTRELGMSLSKSSFHRLRNEDKIVPAKIGKGYYLLNATRYVLGLELFSDAQIAEIRKNLTGNLAEQPSPEPITELDRLLVLFVSTIPEMLLYYTVRKWPGEFSDEDWQLVETAYKVHKPGMGSLRSLEAKILYALRELKVAEEKLSNS